MNANTEETTQNSFVLALGALRKGKTMDECSVKLAELIESVRKTGKKGSFKLTLTIEPSKDAERVMVDDDVVIKRPELSRPSSLFFITEDNRLVKNDPKQQEMPFAVVEGEQQEEPAAQKVAAARNA